jgi:hypothetical protein
LGASGCRAARPVGVRRRASSGPRCRGRYPEGASWPAASGVRGGGHTNLRGVRRARDDLGMAPNFLSCDREQELLLPPSLRDWLPEDHLAWFVLESVAEMDLAAFYGAWPRIGRGLFATPSAQSSSEATGCNASGVMPRAGRGRSSHPGKRRQRKAACACARALP